MHKVQLGLEPSDWKPITTVGLGVREIRIRDQAGAFRVLYVAHIGDAVVVLHAFSEEDSADGEKGLGVGRVTADADLGG